MKKVSSLTGQDLREMFSSATSWLGKSAADIDALNVFPVPDGDTGTNMLLTMRSAVEEAYRVPDHSCSTVGLAMAKGALMGARGNSGVILSQICRGLARGFEGKQTVTAADLARALEQASEMAYKGLSNPVEGTILTVAREVAAAAREASAGDGDLVSAMEAILEAAAQSVANTPNLLPVLKEAGVVDAGGQGLYTILEGVRNYLNGEVEQMQFRRPHIIVSNVSKPASLTRAVAADEIPFGYCTEFMLKGENLDPNKVRKKLEKKGESLIVVGDDSTIRVHIHTLDPGVVIRYATSLGTMHQVSIRNMDEQYEDFLAMQKEKEPELDIAIVAVVSGEGLAEVFSSLGTAAIVPGGQTMNPSTKDILEKVEQVASDKVIILPNNSNIIPTANQVQSLTSKKVKVIPTTTVPQGVAALLAFDYEADFDANSHLMEKALSSVRSVEICRAVRSARVNGFEIKKKQAMGILDGELVAVAEDVPGVVCDVLAKLDMAKAEVVTIYYGADTRTAEAEELSQTIREMYPRLQIELVSGDQPHYQYVISVE